MQQFVITSKQFISGQFHKLKRWRLGMMNTHKDPTAAAYFYARL